jgi:hypothetical protein
MQVGLDFISLYIEKEYEFLIALWTEKNIKIFRDKQHELQHFYAQGLTPEVGRPLCLDDQWFEVGQEEIESICPRDLFQIKHYQNQVFGNFYRCYVSNTSKYGKKTYFSCLYITNIENEWKITSRYNICFTCNSLGQLEDGHKCSECSGSGWNWRGGFKLKELGKLVDVRKFQSPDNPIQMKEYNA